MPAVMKIQEATRYNVAKDGFGVGEISPCGKLIIFPALGPRLRAVCANTKDNALLRDVASSAEIDACIRAAKNLDTCTYNDHPLHQLYIQCCVLRTYLQKQRVNGSDKSLTQAISFILTNIADEYSFAFGVEHKVAWRRIRRRLRD